MLWCPNIANPGLRNVGSPSTVSWVKRMLSYFENQVRSYYNFNQRPEPQLFDQALDGSGIARTAWNVVPFYAVCVCVKNPNNWKMNQLRIPFCLEKAKAHFMRVI